MLAVFLLATVGCAESAASRPTAAAVAQVCTGISDAQAQDFLVDLRDDVRDVQPARETMTAKPFVTHLVGAYVHVRARQGATAEWLARLAECHAAREASGAPCASSECPLRLDGVTTGVSSTGTGFTLAIHSEDPAIAREIIRRAEIVLLAPAPGTFAARP